MYTAGTRSEKWWILSFLAIFPVTYFFLIKQSNQYLHHEVCSDSFLLETPTLHWWTEPWSIGAMGFFSLSDIIITITLLVNATALMSSKVYADPRISTAHESGESSGLLTSSENNNSSEDTTISRFYMFLNWIRRLSCLIVVWNIFFIILMLFVFRS